MDGITQILSAIENGDADTAEQLLPRAYTELRSIAAAKMAGERDGHTLQATALVHEAFLRLARPDGSMGRWNSRGHFFAAAAETMRRILVEHARKKKSLKRGGEQQRTSIDEHEPALEERSDEILAVEEALRKLEEEDPHLAELVVLRYFAGLTIQETAAALEVSERTVNRQWACARAWLFREMSETRTS